MTLESRLELVQTQLINLTELLQLSVSVLHTKKDVARFLNKSEKTIDNYIKNETFILNKHYFVNENNKIEFIPIGILEFKKNPKHKIQVFETKREDKIHLSKTSTKILKGIL